MTTPEEYICSKFDKDTGSKKGTWIWSRVCGIGSITPFTCKEWLIEYAELYHTEQLVKSQSKPIYPNLDEYYKRERWPEHK